MPRKQLHVGSVVFSILALSLSSQAQQTWNLAWSDEFNGISIDNNKWEFADYTGDHGIAAYTSRPQNLFMQNGHLVLQAMRENYNGKKYTGTQVATRNMGDWT